MSQAALGIVVLLGMYTSCKKSEEPTPREISYRRFILELPFEITGIKTDARKLANVSMYFERDTALPASGIRDPWFLSESAEHYYAGISGGIGSEGDVYIGATFAAETTEGRKLTDNSPKYYLLVRDPDQYTKVDTLYTGSFKRNEAGNGKVFYFAKMKVSHTPTEKYTFSVLPKPFVLDKYAE